MKLTKHEIEVLINDVRHSGKALDDKIQEAGLACMQHASEYGDTTLTDKLFAAMPKGSRRLALAEWFFAFGQMRPLVKSNPDDAKRIEMGQTFALDRTRELQLAEASAKPWFDCKKEAPVSDAFDVIAETRRLLARIEKATKDGKNIQGVELAAALRKLVPQA